MIPFFPPYSVSVHSLNFGMIFGSAVDALIFYYSIKRQFFEFKNSQLYYYCFFIFINTHFCYELKKTGISILVLGIVSFVRI